MRVTVVQLGRGVLALTVDHGTTVGAVLRDEGIPVDGVEVRLNSAATALERELADGDLVTVVPLIRGGRRAGR